MPSSNGVYSLPVGYLAVTGQTIQASQHNPPLEDIAAALTARLSRDGTAAMTGPLKVVDGAVGAPAVAFNSAQSTGFYKTAGGNIGVAINGVETVEFGSGGIVTGARFLGELIPYTGITAPALFVLPYGQTLSRTTYAALWAFALTEIAAGNTFYNNGDGATTFGIGDLRGRSIAAIDNMGGSDANRLAAGGLSTVRKIIGGASGQDAVTIAQNQLPNVAPTFTGQSQTVSSNQTNIRQGGTDIGGVSSGGGSLVAQLPAPVQGGITMTFTSVGTVSSINGGVTQQTLNNMQPTMVLQFALFAGA